MHCLVTVVQQQWHLKCEGAALPGFALGKNAAAHQFNQLQRYSKAQTRSTISPRCAHFCLSEWLEETRHLLFSDPDPRISDRETHRNTGIRIGDLFQRNNDFTFIRKFSRVSSEIE